MQAVCQRMGLDTGDRLETNARKLKFLVSSMPDDSRFPPFEDFDVIHDYLQTNSKKTQVRMRKRGQKGGVESALLGIGVSSLFSYWVWQIDGAIRLQCVGRRYVARSSR